MSSGDRRPHGPARGATVGILGHAAELGGAEISLLRTLGELPAGHRPVRVLWLSEGPPVDALRALGLPVDVIPLGRQALATDRFAAGAAAVLPQALSASRTAFAVARWLREGDVGLLMTNSLKSLVVGTTAARLAGVPVAWWVHDRVAPDYLPARIVRALRASARRVPRAVMANSRATASTLPGARGLVVAYPGYAPEQARATPRPRPGGPPVVGLVGRISPTKGQIELVRAAAEVLRTHPGTRFRIVGSPMFGAEAYADAVAAEIERLGVGEHVELVGWVDDVPAELDAMTVCVHASPVPEPFGNVILEAMLRGVPVVATDAGGVPEILAPDGEEPLGLLVPPGDAAALAAAVVALLDDPVGAEARAARAHASAAARFSAGRTLDVVSRVWDDVLGPHRAGPVTRPTWPREPAYRPGREVAWLDGDPSGDDPAPVRVARLPDGPIQVLEGSAALIWRAATTAPATRWLATVASDLDGPVEEVTPQVEDFVLTLVEDGLLEANEPREDG